MKKNKSILVVFVMFIAVLMVFKTSAQSTDNWIDLFNGKNLKGWKQLNGNAEYKVENATIIGITKLNTPNSFLCTKKIFDNFILEFEVFVDPTINSGVQFRSNSFKDYKNGTVHGYQFELDPSDRAFSGGIYDEGRRAWMYPLSLNEKARKAFKNGTWNTCRIEAIGNSIKTWINGIQCSNLVDNKTASGFIGLQVHGIGNNSSMAGKKIKWKNIRIKTENLDKERKVTDPEVQEVSYLINKLTEHEISNGWNLLWDGKTTKGWRGAKLESFPLSGWQINDGVLSVLDTGGGESTGPGDIISNKVFENFELELEFKITEGANSGIKYFVDPNLNKGSGSAIGCEFQIIDDKNHPDAKEGVNRNRTLGSLYDLIAAENLSIPGRGKQFKGIGMWNKARIVVNGSKVSHWLNNEKIVEYKRYTQTFKALVAYSKYRIWPNFGQWPSGHILLQDYGSSVQFRSIKINEFK